MDFAAIGTAVAKSKLLDQVGGEKSGAIKELLGGGDKADALQGLLGKKKPAEAAPSETSEAPTAPAEAPKSVEDQAKEKAAEKLKKLLKF